MTVRLVSLNISRMTLGPMSEVFTVLINLRQEIKVIEMDELVTGGNL
jgi:hypothetical protein